MWHIKGIKVQQYFNSHEAGTERATVILLHQIDANILTAKRLDSLDIMIFFYFPWIPDLQIW